jgi:phage-related protein
VEKNANSVEKIKFNYKKNIVSGEKACQLCGNVNNYYPYDKKCVGVVKKNLSNKGE